MNGGIKYAIRMGDVRVSNGEIPLKLVLSRLIVSCLFALGAVTSGAGEGNGVRADAQTLLMRWCDALVDLQVDRPQSPALHGGALCPACSFQHARICDAVYPLVYLWAATGSEKYLTAAQNALSWTERNYLRPDGSYWNDRKTSWKGTTVFCQIAIGKTLLHWADRLPKSLADEWRGIFLRQSQFLITWFDDPNWRGGRQLSVRLLRSDGPGVEVDGRRAIQSRGGEDVDDDRAAALYRGRTSFGRGTADARKVSRPQSRAR